MKCGGLKMKKVVILKHQNDMRYSRDFFQMIIPKELSSLIYIIATICILSLAIIIFCRIDDVIKTRGIVRTKENVSSVSNIIAGQITEINYKPGQKVEEGQILFKIDSTIYDAQRKTLEYEKYDLENKIKGLESLQTSYYSNKNMCNEKDSLSFSRFNAYLKNKEVLEIRTNIAKYEYDYENQKPDSLRNNYEIEKKNQTYKLALADLNSFKSNFIATINSEKNDKEVALNQNAQNLSKIDKQYSFLQVKSPMSGFVQEISSLNVGDYIEENIKVLNIVPNDSKSFRVEIQIPPKDMGNIMPGQKVKYRLSAFPYFEYKGAEGIITALDPDIRNTPDGKSFYYSVYADIDRISFSNRRGESFPIRAGLETDVRIVLERKSIIYFMLKKLDFIN